MRRTKPYLVLLFLVTIGVVLLWAVITPGGSPVSCVQSTATTHSCGPTAFSVTAGDIIYVCQTMGNASSDLSSAPTDGTNTYTEANHATQGSQTVAVYTASAAATTTYNITCNITADTKFVCGIMNYSGVVALGTTGTANSISANASISQSTTGSNNYIPACFGLNTTVAPTAGTGNFRITAHTTSGTPSTMVINDNTSASPASVTNSITNASIGWAAVSGPELKSALPTGHNSTLTTMGVGQ